MSKLRTIRVLGSLIVFTAVAATAEAGTIITPDGNVVVTDVVAPIGGGLFQYDYTVSDGTMVFGSQGLAVLDIGVTPGVPISGLDAPGGSFAFTTTIDTVGSGSSQQEFVSFLENNGQFTAAPESGFLFDSPVAPAATNFGVTLADGDAATGNGITGPVVTPEPGMLPLCALGAAALIFWRKRFAGSFLR